MVRAASSVVRLAVTTFSGRSWGSAAEADWVPTEMQIDTKAAGTVSLGTRLERAADRLVDWAWKDTPKRHHKLTSGTTQIGKWVV